MLSQRGGWSQSEKRLGFRCTPDPYLGCLLGLSSKRVGDTVAAIPGVGLMVPAANALAPVSSTRRRGVAEAWVSSKGGSCSDTSRMYSIGVAPADILPLPRASDDPSNPRQLLRLGRREVLGIVTILVVSRGQPVCSLIF